MPPLPPHLSPLPARLTFEQVCDLVRFWGYACGRRGGSKYVSDLRACGVLRSVTVFPHGKRARYDSRAVIAAIFQEVER